MVVKSNSKKSLGKVLFGWFFSIIMIFMGVFAMGTPVAATPTEGAAETTTSETAEVAPTGGASCEDSLGALGWLVCPTTGKISEAVDWLYEKIEDILVINPVEAKDGRPIYEIWKYFRAVTNIVFIIFLLVVIYSQITGYGISNYGLKKALPKLIVAAVLVNLSFIICSLAVDLSNIIGNSLRGLFESIEAATMSSMTVAGGGSSHVAMAEMYSAMAGGTALAIGGGLIAFESGAIWMLIPVALGAIVAVAAGLITIALRQAVVALLIMIAPLAMVAYMLPNTEKWFRQWKALLTRMLVFYPAFSLLFGASSLAGWAIIVSSSDGFGILLGTAVQIFPLFFSWKLMKMSGTFLETINSGIHRLAAGPLATNRAWADSHRELTKQRNLASGNVYTPTLRLRQYLENRKIARSEETAEHATTVKNRGLEYSARRNYKGGDLDGTLSKKGMRSYGDQARNMAYEKAILRHKNNMDEGFAAKAKKGTLEHVRLHELDLKNVKMADALKFEQVRTDEIALSNAEGFRNRIEDAMNAHLDAEKLYRVDEHGKLVLRNNHEELEREYRKHFEGKEAEFRAALERYGTMSDVLNGDLHGITRVAARASREFSTLEKISNTEFMEYLMMVPPTADLFNRTMELVEKDKVRNNDAIIAGAKVLLQRGDTDLIKNIVIRMMPNTEFKEDKDGNVVVDGSIDRDDTLMLGTHNSQAWASFLMFDVKDADPSLRRLGKFINLETAKYFSGGRKKRAVSVDEYVLGTYGDVVDSEGNAVLDENGKPKKLTVKRRMKTLEEGTSLDGIERPAMASMRELIEYACAKKDANGNLMFDENGHLELDVDKYIEAYEENFNSMLPAFIGATQKVLSGSEALNGLENFSSGLKDGKGYWDEGEEGADGVKKYRYSEEAREKIENMHTRLTLLKTTAKNPNQLLKTRTDERASDEYHFLREYNMNPEKYGGSGDLSDREKIRKVIQTITGEKGVLARAQAIHNRGSGAAGDAKPFVPGDWLGFDDGSADKFLKELKAKKAQEQAQKVDAADAGQSVIYTEETRDLFVTELKNLWENWRKDTSKDKKPFYDVAEDFVNKRVGESSVIGQKYRNYYEDISDDEGNVDNVDLLDYLIGLMSDPDNY